MRYAILSDIHANLQAWNAVYLDARSNAVERIICLGDIVGYGPHPAEVLQAVHAHVDHIVLGNHDAVIAGKLDEALFNEGAREIIGWTRSRLGRNAIRFLGRLPLALDGGSFRCAHGDFVQPAAFNYVIEPQDADACWQAVDAPLLFIGHTHRPALFVRGASGIPRTVTPQDFEVEPAKRYLVNVGSVGQPRDGDARAAYCLYDTATNAVFWRRIPFDLDAYRLAVSAAGIRADTSYFLRHDPRAGVPPLRTILNFSPAQTPAQAARNVVAVQELKALRRRAATWRGLCLLLLVLVGLLAGAGAAVWHRHQTRSLVLRDPEQPVLRAEAVAERANILPPLLAAARGDGLKGWNLELGDRRRQSFSLRAGGPEPILALRSLTGAEAIRLASPRVAVRPRVKLCMEMDVRKSADFRGSLALVMALTRQTAGGAETADPFLVKEPLQKPRDGWQHAQATQLLPANTTAVQLHVRGTFTGTVEIKAICLTRR